MFSRKKKSLALIHNGMLRVFVKNSLLDQIKNLLIAQKGLIWSIHQHKESIELTTDKIFRYFYHLEEFLLESNTTRPDKLI
jgi:hypothetical protein